MIEKYEDGNLYAISSTGKQYLFPATINDKNKNFKLKKAVIKMDKEKKIKLSVVNEIRKFNVGVLGEKVLVKKETERFSNKVKSNHQRYLEKKQKKLQKEI